MYRTIGQSDLLPASSVSPSTDLGRRNPSCVEMCFIAGIVCRVSGHARGLFYAQPCLSIVVLSTFSSTALVLLDALMWGLSDLSTVPCQTFQLFPVRPFNCSLSDLSTVPCQTFQLFLVRPFNCSLSDLSTVPCQTFQLFPIGVTTKGLKDRRWGLTSVKTDRLLSIFFFKR